MTGFVGNSLDPALALYHTVPGLYCPVDLVQAGELNTMLGNVTDTYLPIYIGGSSNNNGLVWGMVCGWLCVHGVWMVCV